jgi:hypothetical protein
MSIKVVTAGILLALVASTVCSAGWRADCRAQAHACRKSHGASLVTTTTMIQFSGCPSQNCGASHCVMVNGQPYVLMWDALRGLCSLPMPCQLQ